MHFQKIFVPSFVATIAIGVAIAANAVEPDKDGFYEPRDAMMLRIKRVGILPLMLPDEMQERKDVSERVENRIVEQLTAAGFVVVGSQPYSDAFDAMNHQVGGIYNPNNGERDSKKYAAVSEHALRSFVDNEKLDAVLRMRITSTTAFFYDEIAALSRVAECTTGKVISKSITGKRCAPARGKGELASLSLAMMLAEPNKNLFFSMGGIQLRTYLDPAAADSAHQFINVPRANLLRDMARLDRAVDIATAPLAPSVKAPESPESSGSRNSARTSRTKKKPSTKTPLLTPNFDLAEPPEGAIEPPPQPFKVDRAEILAATKTIAVVPVVSGAGEREKEISKRYADSMTASLDAIGIRAVNATELSDRIRTETDKAGGSYDAFTGGYDESRVTATRKKVADEFLRKNHVDAILWSRFERRRAHYDGDAAEWDGVIQNPVTLADQVKDPAAAYQRHDRGTRGVGTGTMAALSLEVVLRNSNDVELYHDYGGVHLLEQLTPDGGGYANLPKKTALTAQQFLTSADRDRQAVIIALRALVGTTDASNQKP